MTCVVYTSLYIHVINTCTPTIHLRVRSTPLCPRCMVDVHASVVDTYTYVDHLYIINMLYVLHVIHLYIYI